MKVYRNYEATKTVPSKHIGFSHFGSMKNLTYKYTSKKTYSRNGLFCGVNVIDAIVQHDGANNVSVVLFAP